MWFVFADRIRAAAWPVDASGGTSMSGDDETFGRHILRRNAEDRQREQARQAEQNAAIHEQWQRMTTP